MCLVFCLHGCLCAVCMHTCCPRRSEECTGTGITLVVSWPSGFLQENKWHLTAESTLQPRIIVFKFRQLPHFLPLNWTCVSREIFHSFLQNALYSHWNKKSEPDISSKYNRSKEGRHWICLCINEITVK